MATDPYLALENFLLLQRWPKLDNEPLFKSWREFGALYEQITKKNPAAARQDISRFRRRLTVKPVDFLDNTKKVIAHRLRRHKTLAKDILADFEVISGVILALPRIDVETQASVTIERKATARTILQQFGYTAQELAALQGAVHVIKAVAEAATLRLRAAVPEVKSAENSVLAIMTEYGRATAVIERALLDPEKVCAPLKSEADIVVFKLAALSL